MAIRPDGYYEKNRFSLCALTRILRYYGEELEKANYWLEQEWVQTPAESSLDLEAVCLIWREYTRSEELDRDINELDFCNEIICAPIPDALVTAPANIKREMLVKNGAIFELENGGFLVMTDEHDEIVWLPPMVQIFAPAYNGYLQQYYGKKNPA